MDLPPCRCQSAHRLDQDEPTPALLDPIGVVQETITDQAPATLWTTTKNKLSSLHQDLPTVTIKETEAGGLPKRLSVGLLVPYTTFKVREYSRAVSSAISSLRKQELSFLSSYRFQPNDVYTDMLKLNPSPTGTIFFPI